MQGSGTAVPVLVHLYRLTPKPVLFYSRHVQPKSQVSQICDITPHPELWHHPERQGEVTTVQVDTCTKYTQKSTRVPVSPVSVKCDTLHNNN